MRNSRAEIIRRISRVYLFFLIIGLLGNVVGLIRETYFPHKPYNHTSSYGTTSSSSHASEQKEDYSIRYNYRSGSSIGYNSSSSSANSNSSSDDIDSNSYNGSTNSNSTTTKHKNSYNSEMYNYKNADAYAEDYAEDYEFDEFGGKDTAENYDYGYEEAYDAWEEEMDD